MTRKSPRKPKTPPGFWEAEHPIAGSPRAPRKRQVPKQCIDASLLVAICGVARKQKTVGVFRADLGMLSSERYLKFREQSGYILPARLIGHHIEELGRLWSCGLWCWAGRGRISGNRGWFVARHGAHCAACCLASQQGSHAVGPTIAQPPPTRLHQACTKSAPSRRALLCAGSGHQPERTERSRDGRLWRRKLSDEKRQNAPLSRRRPRVQVPSTPQKKKAQFLVETGPFSLGIR